MNLTDAPDKFPQPFGAQAGVGFIRPIPNASQIGSNPGYASLHDGFVPLNATPTGAGGIPPFIQDINGILKQVSAWCQWAQAGGPVFWDLTFAGQIGGYPKGAILHSNADANKLWINQTDGNVTNPDAAGAGWANLFAPIFVNPTFTGTLTSNGPAVFQNTVNLGGNAIATTQPLGDNTTLLATDAFVQALAANANADAKAYARGLVDGFYAPQGSYTSQNSGGGGGSVSPTLTFTAPVAGMLHISASRVNSAVDGAPHSCQLVLDGGELISDGSFLGMAHSASVAVGAGGHSMTYNAQGGVQFNAVISFLYVPNPPVY